MKGKVNKLDDLNKVFMDLTDNRQNMLILSAKKLLKIQKSIKPALIAKEKKAD
jgi:hypothetical protein